MTSEITRQMFSEAIVIVEDEVLRILLVIDVAARAPSLFFIVAEQVAILLYDPLVVLDGLTADEVFNIILHAFLTSSTEPQLAISHSHVFHFRFEFLCAFLGLVGELLKDHFAHPGVLPSFPELIEQLLVALIFLLDLFAELERFLLIPITLTFQLKHLLFGFLAVQLSDKLFTVPRHDFHALLHFGIE